MSHIGTPRQSKTSTDRSATCESQNENHDDDERQEAETEPIARESVYQRTFIQEEFGNRSCGSFAEKEQQDSVNVDQKLLCIRQSSRWNQRKGVEDS